MAGELYALTAEDRAMVQDALRRLTAMSRTTSGRPDASRNDRDDITAPEVYIAKTPRGGIPPLTCDGCLTGTGTNIVAGSAMCPIWRVLDGGNVRLVYGQFKRVYNIGFSAVPGNAFTTVERDKYGTWLCNRGAVGTGTFDPCAVDCREPTFRWACVGDCFVYYEISADESTVTILEKDCTTRLNPDTSECETCCGNPCGTGSWTDCTMPDHWTLVATPCPERFCFDESLFQWCLQRGGGPGTFDCGGGINGYSWTGVNSQGQAVVSNCYGLWTYVLPDSVHEGALICHDVSSNQSTMCNTCGVNFEKDGVTFCVSLEPFGCDYDCWQDNVTGEFICSSANEGAHATLMSEGYANIDDCIAVCHGDCFCWLPGDGTGETVCSTLDLSVSGYTQLGDAYPDCGSCTVACPRPACWTDGAGYCSVCQLGDPSAGYPAGTSFTQSGGPFSNFDECLTSNCEVVYCYELITYDDEDCTENETSNGFYCDKICPGQDGSTAVDMTVCHANPSGGGILFSVISGPHNSYADCSAAPCPPA